MKFTIELTDTHIIFTLPSGVYSKVQKDSKFFWSLVFGCWEDFRITIRAWKEGNL